MRNVIKKRKAAGTVFKASRPRKRQRKVQDNPRAASKDRQVISLHCALINLSAHREQLYGRVMGKKPFLHAHHKQAGLRLAKLHLNKQVPLCAAEIKIELFGHAKRRCAWRQNNTATSISAMMYMAYFLFIK